MLIYRKKLIKQKLFNSNKYIFLNGILLSTKTLLLNCMYYKGGYNSWE